MSRRARVAATFVLAASAVTAAAALATDGLTILNEGDTGMLWRPVAETQAMPAYPGVIQDKSEDVCVSIGYMLREDGTTSDFAVLDAWGSKAEGAKPTSDHFLRYSQNALAAVQRWRFQSLAGATAKLRPVYTSATFAFSTVGTNPEALKSRCRVKDLEGFITAAKAEAAKKTLNRRKLESERAQYPPRISGAGGF